MSRLSPQLAISCYACRVRMQRPRSPRISARAFHVALTARTAIKVRIRSTHANRNHLSMTRELNLQLDESKHAIHASVTRVAHHLQEVREVQ